MRWVRRDARHAAPFAELAAGGGAPRAAGAGGADDPAAPREGGAGAALRPRLYSRDAAEAPPARPGLFRKLRLALGG